MLERYLKNRRKIQSVHAEPAHAGEKFRGKAVSVQRVCDMIQPGQRIYISSGPAIPARTISAILESDNHNIQDLEIIQLITLGKYLSQDETRSRKYRLKTFNVGESISKELSMGRVDFIPANLIEIPGILSSGAVGVDIAIVQTSPPDERGFMSLGVAVDVANIIIKTASIVIAEVNPEMPFTLGETSIHIDQVDYIVESDVPLLERDKRPVEPGMDRIAWHVSNLIQDGSTVVLHLGRVFDAIARHLHSKRNLGVLTHVVSDWVIDLVESGAISLERSRFTGGLVTTSYCYGSRDLYNYVNRNPVVEFYPISRLANPLLIRRLNKLVSIMNVKKIDISGESVVFHSGDNLLSGYESKLNFAVAATFSKNGKAIVALQSVDMEGNSNIVINHSSEDSSRVRSTLGVTRYVVTEYGVANLYGKSVRERAMAMIDIAHPAHRDALLEKAKELGCAYPDQIYMSEHASDYPLELETIKTFADNLEVKFRPIKPSDEDKMRRLFYQFSDENKYFRYFARIRIMPHREMQNYVNIDYKTTLSIVGVLERNRVETIIAEARYSYYPEEDVYEMAFTVDEKHQGRGIGTFLLDYLIMIAHERGIQKLSANILYENSRMIRVFDKARVKPVTSFDSGIVVKLFHLDGLDTRGNSNET